MYLFIKETIKSGVVFIQLLSTFFLLPLSFFIALSTKSMGRHVFVGLAEISGILRSISNGLDGCISINLFPYKFSSDKFDIDLTSLPKFSIYVGRILFAPFLLAFIASHGAKLIYLGERRILGFYGNSGLLEARILNLFNVKLIYYFVGSEIRAPRLLIPYANKQNFLTSCTWLPNEFLSDEHDAVLKERAGVANKYGYRVFSFQVDQMSYLKSETENFRYFQNMNDLVTRDEKFRDPRTLRIIHCPSSPFLKGTQLVRAAIEKLRHDGFEFEYYEFSDLPHADLMKELENAHIVLNEFYAYVPGCLGVEAMMRNCALVTAAHRSIEPGLPPESDQAWLTAFHYEVYEKLKELLDNPSRIELIAKQGIDWVTKYADAKKNIKIFD